MVPASAQQGGKRRTFGGAHFTTPHPCLKHNGDSYPTEDCATPPPHVAQRKSSTVSWDVLRCRWFVLINPPFKAKTCDLPPAVCTRRVVRPRSRALLVITPARRRAARALFEVAGLPAHDSFTPTAPMSVAISTDRRRRRRPHVGPSPSPPPSSPRFASLLLLSSITTASGAPGRHHVCPFTTYRGGDLSLRRGALLGRRAPPAGQGHRLRQERPTHPRQHPSANGPGRTHLPLAHRVSLRHARRLDGVHAGCEALVWPQGPPQRRRPPQRGRRLRRLPQASARGYLLHRHCRLRHHRLRLLAPPLVHLRRRGAPLQGRVPAQGEWSEWWDMGWFKDYVHDKVRAQNGTDVLTFYNNLVRPEAPPVRRSSSASRRAHASPSPPRPSVLTPRSTTRPFWRRSRTVSTPGRATTSSGCGLPSSDASPARCPHPPAPPSPTAKPWRTSTSCTMPALPPPPPPRLPPRAATSKRRLAPTPRLSPHRRPALRRSRLLPCLRRPRPRHHHHRRRPSFAVAATPTTDSSLAPTALAAALAVVAAAPAAAAAAARGPHLGGER